ncbi:YkvR family protein [Bacillus infantis]|jgi:hypothetical protein|uniref:DUF3219 family protein n=1 Tax=Bacillus infantis TaxID=324767 RepID=UPI001CD2FF55|nr:DUF3219 family protein [Bacillus infantis]MCA1037886.1 YkvR family protein [Bacillus infantis]MCR6610695.1 YkvR family protein [Bacillus infantis]
MAKQVILNGNRIDVYNYKEETLAEKGEQAIHLSFDFKVSHQEYHDITTLLYDLYFDVSVPEDELEFRGMIDNYYTSLTNLYEEDAVGEFHLELKETDGKED